MRGRSARLLSFRSLTASAATARAPETEITAAPLPYIDGTLQIRVRITRSVASRAANGIRSEQYQKINANIPRVPIEGIDLPEPHVEAAIGVVVGGISVTAALVAHDALAAS